MKKHAGGRPRGDRVTRAMGIRIEESVLSRLATLSKETGISQNQLVINFIELGLDLAASPAGKAAFLLRAWIDALREPLYACEVLKRTA